MTVGAESVTVATTATALNAAEASGSDVLSIIVKVPAGGATVYVGGSGVTTATGFPVAAGESVSLDVGPGEGLYGIVAAATQAVNVLRVGVG